MNAKTLKRYALMLGACGPARRWLSKFDDNTDGIEIARQCDNEEWAAWLAISLPNMTPYTTMYNQVWSEIGLPQYEYHEAWLAYRETWLSLYYGVFDDHITACVNHDLLDWIDGCEYVVRTWSGLGIANEPMIECTRNKVAYIARLDCGVLSFYDASRGIMVKQFACIVPTARILTYFDATHPE